MQLLAPTEQECTPERDVLPPHRLHVHDERVGGYGQNFIEPTNQDLQNAAVFRDYSSRPGRGVFVGPGQRALESSTNIKRKNCKKKLGPQSAADS